ncbi:MAG: hypothetical protein HGB02_08645 [Chlorobiaceae bacterium]|nr:hypothetical protein [Chlorobiaceae bacterium]
MTDFRDIFAKADRQIIERVGDPATLDGKPVRGELTTPIDQSELSGGMTGFQQLAFRLPDGEAATVIRGSVLVCLGDTYEVVRFKPMNDGFTMLFLKLKP